MDREFLGESIEWEKLVRAAERFAQADGSVALFGDCGVGLHTVARFIHDQSPRKAGPFLATNRASYADEALDSILFGYPAATGPAESPRGAVEAAAGGTLFIDSFEAIGLEVQCKLLELIRSARYADGTSGKRRSADVRIIAGFRYRDGPEPRDILATIREGRFLEELYSSFQPLFVPNLADRADDIPILVAKLADELLPGVELSEGFLEEARRGDYRPSNLYKLNQAVFCAVASILIDIDDSQETFKLEARHFPLWAKPPPA